MKQCFAVFGDLFDQKAHLRMRRFEIDGQTLTAAHDAQSDPGARNATSSATRVTKGSTTTHSPVPFFVCSSWSSCTCESARPNRLRLGAGAAPGERTRDSRNARDTKRACFTWKIHTTPPLVQWDGGRRSVRAECLCDTYVGRTRRETGQRHDRFFALFTAAWPRPVIDSTKSHDFVADDFSQTLLCPRGAHASGPTIHLKTP